MGAMSNIPTPRPGANPAQIRTRNTVGIVLVLATALLWSFSRSDTLQQVAMVATVITGLWWAFGLRLLGGRQRS